MTRQTQILVVDDRAANVKQLVELLECHGHRTITATSGEEALEQLARHRPDLVLLDVIMPGMTGYEACRRIRANAEEGFLPVVMMTEDPNEERSKGLEAGADDFVTRPINHAELLARVRSLLRIKELHDRVRSQARHLAEWGNTLEQRVQRQVAQIDRLGRLKQSFSPRLAEVIVGRRGDNPLTGHRRAVTVVCLGLRGFTSFAETADPEDVMAVVREFHAQAGQLVLKHEGTLEHFTGDGLMIFFNAPLEVADHEAHAVEMAVEMRTAVQRLQAQWRRRGYQLGLGAGIATGYAAIGIMGFDGRWDYGVIGSVANVAAGLCAEAGPGQIMVSQRFLATIGDLVQTELVGELTLKGIQKPVTIHNILCLKDREPTMLSGPVELPHHWPGVVSSDSTTTPPLVALVLQ